MAVSSIVGVRYNEAVFVVMPLDVVLPFLSARRRRRYALGRIAVLAMVSLLAAVGVLHQPLWTLILVVLVPMLTIALDLPHGLLAQRDGAETAPEAVVEIAPDAAAEIAAVAAVEAASEPAPEA